MSYFSQSEIETILDNLKAAYLVVIGGGEEYSLNDGQGMMKVKRTTANDMLKQIEYWQGERDDLDTSGGIVSMEANH